MKAKDIILASIISSAAMTCASHNSKEEKSGLYETKTEQVATNTDSLQIDESDSATNSENIKKEIYLCLEPDGENAYTHRKVLETISNPENTILEYPTAQLFKRYEGNPHPLRVSLVGRDFSALLGKNGIERLLPKIPQKLTSRSEEITSSTKYEMGDTLRFSLIDPLLKDDFPKYLSNQLQEEGFEKFSDVDSLDIIKKQHEKRYPFLKDEEKSDFIYDIVVKRAPSGKSALALYRDGELFMATYASVGLPFIKTRNGYKSAKTRRGQFKVLGKDPYKRSLTYGNAPMPESLNIIDGFYIHQGYVTGNDLSHGCVRIPGVYADILFSLVDDADIFIANNLYKSKQ